MGAFVAVAVNAAGASVLLVDSLGCAQPFAASLAAMVLYSAFIMVGHRQKLATGTALGVASTAAASGPRSITGRVPAAAWCYWR